MSIRKSGVSDVSDEDAARKLLPWIIGSNAATKLTFLHFLFKQTITEMLC